MVATGLNGSGLRPGGNRHAQGAADWWSEGAVFAGYFGADITGYGMAVVGAGISSQLAGGRYEDASCMMGILRLAGGFFNYASYKTDEAKKRACMATSDPAERPV